MAAQTKIPPSNWDNIVEQIHKGKCVPFLGAAANVSAAGYEGLPLGRDIAVQLIAELTGLRSFDPAILDPGRLARDLLEQLKDLQSTDPKIADLVKSVRPRLVALSRVHRSFGPYSDLMQLRMLDLARVALYVRVENDLPRLLERLQQLLPDDHRQPSKLLQTIAALPIRLIITTNYDSLMERALGTRPHKVVTQPRAGFKDDESWNDLEAELADTEEVIVYKIHGSFKDPSRGESWSPEVIITEEDYIEFLTVVGREVGGIPTHIKSLIQDGTLLFLGYGLEDWDLRTIFKGLVESLEPSARRKAFAIRKNAPDFWVRFWDKKDVTIYNVDLYRFADQLQKEYAKYLRNGGVR